MNGTRHNAGFSRLESLSMVLILVLGSPQWAAAELPTMTLAHGVIRIPQAGVAAGRYRSIWARGKAVVLSLKLPESAKELSPVKADDGLIRQVRVVERPDRTELVIHVDNDAPEQLLGRVSVRADDKDLLVSIDDARAAMPKLPPPPSLKPRADRAAGGVAASRTDGRKAKGSSAAQASDEKSAGGVAGLVGRKTAGPKASDARQSRVVGQKASLSAAGPLPGGRALGVIVFGLALAAGAAWWLKRKRGRLPGSNVHIDVISSRTISGKHRLVLVEAGGDLLLLGCTDKGVELLRSFDRGRLDQHSEKAFFAEGVRLDREAQSRAKTDRATAQEPQPRTSEFLSHLDQQLRTREQQAKARPRADAPSQQQQAAHGEAQVPANYAAAALTARKSEVATAANPAPEDSPLDEAWAAGILQMRRASRKVNQTSTKNTWHYA